MAAIVDPRATVRRIADEQGVSLATLSRVVGRSDRWLDRFVREGVPAALPADVRRTLARYGAVREWDLGGPPGPAPAQTPRRMRAVTPVYAPIRL